MAKENQENLPAVVQTAITNQKIDLSKVTLLMPTQTFGQVIGEYDKVVMETVVIDPDPHGSDVYEVAKGKLSLGKRPLGMISSALGIVWDPVTTGIVESTKRKARAKATGAMRKPNGEWIPTTEEKSVDLDAIEEEQRIKQEEYAEEGCIVEWKTSQKGKRYPVYEPWAEHGGEKAKQAHIKLEVRKAVLPYWKFKDERANTGAKERVVKWFLALKDNYTADELSKPIVFPRIITDTSKLLANPATRQIAIDKMHGAVKTIFGPGTGEEPQKQLEQQPQYEVEKNGSGAETEEELAEKKAEEVIVPWDAEPKETEEEGKLREMVEDVRERRKKFDKNLPKDAKSFIDDILAREKYDLKTISALVARFDEFEKTAKEMGVPT